MPELEKIFEGSSIQANLIKLALEEIGIEPIIKDRTESGRLAGFASEIPMQVEVYVFENQYDEAIDVLKNLSLED
ncbi:putative signal transducing protein [Capnocytophaga stomatis]|uniref:DUF2007 domain-containing protein n=1 Tax=Capnocytophaga stomatis TaxID=1848904 RepID=A0ABW8Q8I0_9FLAO|nr:DUF2007 domain-containing protein [Capnocytophaga stomatis]GIJ93047.1 hypothetical protein CAPN002_02650 [Capnocytophaga stomatis]